MKYFTLVLLVAGLAIALPLPDAGAAPANAVEFATVRELALRKAEAEYPGARLGVELPYVDETGATVAWSFVFRTDGKPMGNFGEVRDDILAERELLGPNTDLTRWRSKYAHITVSARTDRRPILRYGFGAGEFWAVGEAALERARQSLGSGARLSRLYFVHPVVYFEFENAAGRRVVLSEHFERAWDSRESFAGEIQQTIGQMRARHGFDAAGTAAAHAAEWQEALAEDFAEFTEVFVPNPERAPFYDWSYGCTPTAGAIVLGYIDRTQDYGKLVKWFAKRYDMVEGETDWQIPNTQRECAIGMGTDTTRGGTSIYAISGGLQQVGMDNGYIFTMLDALGASWNDWAWDTIKIEINAGRAHIWSALWEIHSLAAFGYREPQKEVYVHNTWWAPAEWWGHSGDDWAHVASPDPWGGNPKKVELLYPKGDTNYNGNGRGEQLYVGDTVRVTWANSGDPGTRVEVDLSLDAGRTWTALDANAPDNGEYRWVIGASVPTNDSARLRLRQFDGSDLTSADGSFGSFRILREPLPPPQVSPPNGLPVMNPPIELVVDSARARSDSFDFKLVLGTDTLLRQTGTSPRWSLEGFPFVYNRTYKWLVRGHNQYGWGDWSTAWTFRVLFQGLAEASPVATPHQFEAPGIARLGAGSVRFAFGLGEPGREVAVFDASGTQVRSIAAPAAGRLDWDLRDSGGRLVSTGLYFLRAGSSGPVRKLVIVE
ncbi:MAG: hypothetical protein R6X13_03340 [bacterium]